MAIDQSKSRFLKETSYLLRFLKQAEQRFNKLDDEELNAFKEVFLVVDRIKNKKTDRESLLEQIDDKFKNLGISKRNKLLKLLKKENISNIEQVAKDINAISGSE